MSVLDRLPMEATAEETLRACLGEWARLAGGRGLLGLEEVALAEAGLGALGDLVDELNRYAGMLEEREEDEEESVPHGGDLNWAREA